MNVHLYPSYFTNESRILRIVKTLFERGVFNHFLLIGIHRKDLPDREVIGAGIVLQRVRPAFGNRITGYPGRLVKAIGWYVAVFRLLRDERPQCVNSHSLAVLPLGYAVARARRARLVYDTHELETETLSSRGLRRQLSRMIERLLIHRCDAVSVVNQSIAGWYLKRYRLHRVDVVRNMPILSASDTTPTGKLRAAAGIPEGDCRVYLYQGLLAAGRGLELLLEAFRELGAPHHLVLLGYGPLEAHILESSSRFPNIHFVPAVPPDQLLPYTRDADVGLSLIENACLSYFYSLPNKVFEYAAAGVPSLVSNFPEMAGFVGQTGAGWAVEPRAGELVRKILSLTDEEIRQARQHLQACQRQFGWDTQVPALLAMYARLGFAPRSGHEERMP